MLFKGLPWACKLPCPQCPNLPSSRRPGLTLCSRSIDQPHPLPAPTPEAGIQCPCFLSLYTCGSLLKSFLIVSNLSALYISFSRFLLQNSHCLGRICACHSVAGYHVGWGWSQSPSGWNLWWHLGASCSWRFPSPSFLTCGIEKRTVALPEHCLGSGVERAHPNTPSPLYTVCAHEWSATPLTSSIADTLVLTCCTDAQQVGRDALSVNGMGPQGKLTTGLPRLWLEDQARDRENFHAAWLHVLFMKWFGVKVMHMYLLILFIKCSVYA